MISVSALDEMLGAMKHPGWNPKTNGKGVANLCGGLHLSLTLRRASAKIAK
jgi:hypothetical protein